MKYVFLTLTLIFLIGCSKEHIKPTEMQVFQKYCSDKGGIDYIKSSDFYGTSPISYCKCINGESITSTKAHSIIYKE